MTPKKQTLQASVQKRASFFTNTATTVAPLRNKQDNIY